MKYFHLSECNQNNKMFRPRVPSDRMDGEDGKTKRICVSTCISGCIRAITSGLFYLINDSVFYVHVPVDYKGRVFAPTKKEVPDVNVTREKWLLDKTRMKCIGKIRVFESSRRDPYDPYTKLIRYKWIEKYE